MQTFFKLGLRVCNTQCIGSRDSLCQKWGVPLALARFLTFVSRYPLNYFVYFLFAIILYLDIIDNMDSDNRCSCLGG